MLNNDFVVITDHGLLFHSFGVAHGQSDAQGKSSSFSPCKSHGFIGEMDNTHPRIMLNND